MQAREFLRQGKTGDARKCFQKCVDISSEMALELMKACRAKNVDCIVAPYEADAQLAYLSLQGKKKKNLVVFFKDPKFSHTFYNLNIP